MQKTLTVLAPAKINLYLHMTGLRDDGYHLLDSLIAFADIGDRVIIEPAEKFSFLVRGHYAGAFTAQEKEESPDSSNIVVRAFWAYAEILKRKPDCRVTLIKNIPLAAGIGGGSSDAAAVLWGLSKYWSAPHQTESLSDLAEKLGADVPVCMKSAPMRVSGIGEILEEAPFMVDFPIVLVNPVVRCPTVRVFKAFDEKYRGKGRSLVTLPEDLSDLDDLLVFLQQQDNDLQDFAVGFVPEITGILDILRTQKGCELARMSGSGATCFGLFRDEFDAIDAAEEISRTYPAWWVRSGFINRVSRY